MLMVPTYIKQSSIQGMGLFAASPIKKGEIIWKYVPSLDFGLTQEQVDALPEYAKKTFLNYCYVDAEIGLHILCFDDARFMNHSDQPNTTQLPNDVDSQGYTVATRDIDKDEELTCDYTMTDDAIDEKLGR